MSVRIVKRNGESVEFVKEKVDRVVSLALGETNESIEWSQYEKLLDDVCAEVKDGMSVEDVSNQIEKMMMKYGLYESAKRFILFRAERKHQRESGDKTLVSKYFSKEFLKKYRYAKEPFEPLGGFVKARTYARWLPDEGRRETWYETVKRAVEFNLSLAEHTKEEAEQLFHNVFYLKQNLSGRMTWLGGTPTAHSNALGLFNCAFKVVDSYDAFYEAYTVLMLGAGLGVRITKDDLSTMLPMRQGVELLHRDYTEKIKSERQEYTTIIEHDKTMVEIVVGDSRGGFATALQLYFEILYKVQYKDINTIIFNYDNVRPKGLRIHGFGGKSSGFKPLKKMFEKLHKVTQKKTSGKSYFKTIDVLDIICIIAENVVSGNVRRSSIMVLCDEDDSDIINAKNELYTQENGKWIVNESIIHRQMSNNTIIYKNRPSREKIKDNFQKLRRSGEPATLNLQELVKRNPNAKGLNP